MTRKSKKKLQRRRAKRVGGASRAKVRPRALESGWSPARIGGVSVLVGPFIPCDGGPGCPLNHSHG